MDKYKYKREVKSVRWLLFGVILSLFATEVIFEAVISFMSVPPHKYLRMTIVEIAAFMFPLFIFKNTSLKKFNNYKMLRLNPISYYDVLLVVLLGMGGQFIMMVLNLPLQYISKVFFHAGEVAAKPGDISFWTVLFGIIAVGILPSLLEEFWMRGLVFGVFDKTSTKDAIYFTTFIFAIFHGSLEELPGYIFMGVMAAFVLLKFNSLYAAVLYHLASNLTALFFSMVIRNLVGYLWMIFTGMTLMFIAVFFIINKTKKANIVKSDKKTNLFIESIISLPIILSMVIVILKYCIINM